jgi:hypothetical protein
MLTRLHQSGISKYGHICLFTVINEQKCITLIFILSNSLFFR